jgi:hypothetical protein
LDNIGHYVPLDFPGRLPKFSTDERLILVNGEVRVAPVAAARSAAFGLSLSSAIDPNQTLTFSAK